MQYIITCIFAFFIYIKIKTNFFSGPYMLTAGLVTFLFSKEIWVVEHEIINSTSLLLIYLYVYYKFGDKIGAFLDAGIKVLSV